MVLQQWTGWNKSKNEALLITSATTTCVWKDHMLSLIDTQAMLTLQWRLNVLYEF